VLVAFAEAQVDAAPLFFASVVHGQEESASAVFVLTQNAAKHGMRKLHPVILPVDELAVPVKRPASPH